MKNLVALNFRALFLFSIPSIFASLLEPLSGVVDTALVGRMNTQWLSAMGIAAIILSSFTWMFNFLIHASTQGVSEAYGKNDYSELCARIKISTLVALILGIVTSIILYLIRVPLYKFTGASESLIPLVDEYFSVRILGHTVTLLFTTSLSQLRGLGKVRASFFIVGLSTFSNIVLSWYFLYVLKIGLKGAAIGTVLGNVLGLIATIVVLSKSEIIKEFFKNSKFEREGLFTFGKNSLDLFGRSFSLTSCFFLCTKFAAGLGVTQLAAHQILLQVWLFSSFFIDGVAITANVVGANLKAKGDKESLRKMSSILLGQGFLIGVFFSATYFLFDTYVQGLFTTDSKVIEELAKVWPLIALTQWFASVAYVYDGLLFGFGAFSFIRKHMMIGVFAVFLPLALLVFVYDNLLILWIALSVLLIYRAASGFYKTRSEVGVAHG